MATTAWKYLPILKWKRGEQDALRYLKKSQWEGVVPIAELQPASTIEVAALREALLEQVEKSVPVGEAIGIDTIYFLEAQAKQVDVLVGFCNYLQNKLPDRRIVPVIHGALVEALESSSEKAKELLLKFPEVILRLRMDLTKPTQVKPSVVLVKKVGFKTSAIHILVDQFSLVGKDPAACKTAVQPYLDAAIAEKCASVTVAGGSFPINLMGYKAGTHDIMRVEWQIWDLLKKSHAYSSVQFSDYAVTNPSRLEEIDPTQVNPSISIRYASDAFWRLYKGGGFKKGKPGTLKNLCRLLTLDTNYSGATFSYGDANYDALAKSPKITNGIPWTWRRDATNHHVVLTAGNL